MLVYHSSSEIGQLRTNKVRAVAALAGVHLQYEINTNPPIATKLFRPSLPILVTKSGAAIPSSNNIIRYIANSFQNMYADNIQQASEIDQWLDLISSKFEPSIETVLAALKNQDVPVGKAIKEATEFLKTVNQYLKDRKFLGSAELSIADVSLYANLSVLFTYVYDETKRGQFSNIVNLFKVVGLAIGTGLPPVVLCKNTHLRFKNLHLQQSNSNKPLEIIEQNQAPKKPEPITEKKYEPKKILVIQPKHLIYLDVKPYDFETDLQALAQRVLKIEIEGVKWNQQFLILPLAYGINKIEIGCHVDSSMTATDVIDAILDVYDEEVQSIDVSDRQKKSTYPADN